MNKIIIPTSLGITALVLVAFISFGMVDTDDVITTDTELEYYDTSELLLPPDDLLFESWDYFDTHLDESKYDHLVDVIQKYDDILVFDVYRVFEYSYSEEEEEEYIAFLKTGMHDDGTLVNPTDDELLIESESWNERLKAQDGKVLEEYIKIYLSQDPIREDVYSSEYTYELEGITITMWPKGDFTTEAKLERQSEDQIIFEVSPRIVGELTPMKRVILVTDDEERLEKLAAYREIGLTKVEIQKILDDDDINRVYTFPAKFSYIDDEHRVSIVGAITNEQVSALAMAISEYKKP